MNILKCVRAGRRSSLLASLGLVLAAALGLGAASAQSSNVVNAVRPAASARPNIIFILADDLGYGDLGCYGQAKIQTPHLDQLAREGRRFSQFYAGSTVGGPSRCALMTGWHTGHATIRGNANVPLGTNDLTVAALLKQAGYTTGLIGKWGLGNEGTTGVPQNQGFDDFLGFLDQVHANDCYPDYVARHDPHHLDETSLPLPENWGGKRGLYTHDYFTYTALNFVRVYQPSRANHYAPFFLYLAYTIPHANNAEGQRTGNGMQVPSDAPYAAEPWPQPEKNKAAMITRLDRDVGRLMDKLREWNLDDNTLVLFSSDNGPHKEGGVDPKFFQSSGPLRGLKRDLYEGGIRVPFIARWPGKIKPGESDLQAAFWDFLPTMAELVGTNAPAKLDGISFLPTLLGQTQTNQHAFLYWEFHERGFQQAVRMGDWKAVRLGPGKALELYDLKSDLGEKKNVAADNPKVVAQIEDYLKTARTDSAQWPVREAKNQAQ